MTEFFAPIPLAFAQAFRDKAITAGTYALGCYLADESYRCRNTNGGIATVTLGQLADQFDVTTEAIRVWLHRLKDEGWITFDVRQGQRKPWQIELARLAISPATSKATSKDEGGSRLEVTSNSPAAAWRSTPRPERGSGPSRLPTSRARDETKRNETKRTTSKTSIESGQQGQQSGAGRTAVPYVPNLGSYTGCRAVRGSHGSGYKHDPLGTSPPPAGWPHPPPTREEVARALGLMPDEEHDVDRDGEHHDEQPRSNAGTDLAAFVGERMAEP